MDYFALNSSSLCKKLTLNSLAAWIRKRMFIEVKFILNTHAYKVAHMRHITLTNIHLMFIVCYSHAFL